MSEYHSNTKVSVVYPDGDGYISRLGRVKKRIPLGVVELLIKHDAVIYKGISYEILKERQHERLWKSPTRVSAGLN